MPTSSAKQPVTQRNAAVPWPEPRQAPMPAEGRKPMNARLVLLIAALLPGMGQVLNHQPQRGAMIAFFTLLLGWVTYHLTTPEHSFLGRYAGGIFVHAMAMLDAYRWARVREEHYRRGAVAANTPS